MEYTLTEAAMKMTLLDAIKRGHTGKKELIEYMKTEAFAASTEYYFTKLDAEFS